TPAQHSASVGQMLPRQLLRPPEREYVFLFEFLEVASTNHMRDWEVSYLPGPISQRFTYLVV
ncbi:hypothetical protein BD311DRAFT_756686, partial [Dichomitus squalens]